MVDLFCEPGGTLQGDITLPGDKSISHRAIILGSIAQGKTEITHFLPGEDCLATLKAMRALGVTIENPTPETVIVHGVGLHGLKPPKHPIDCGNSGTSMRLLSGLLAAQPFSSTLIGDNSLTQRPMERIISPLKQMGANIEGQAGCPPLTILPTKGLNGIHYSLPMASAQVKSCLLLAGLYASGKTTLVENIPSRDHTERMLKALGAQLQGKHNQITLTPGNELLGQTITVPSDISSAAFFIAGASFTPGSHLRLQQVGVNPKRLGIITILREMGANITLHHERLLNDEPIADIEVKGSKLNGITVLNEWVPSAIDEFPMIFVAAALAKGETIIRGIQELRFKETDRIAAMAEGLKTLGVSLAILPDGIIIRGGEIKGGTVDSKGDHRIAMAFAMASLAVNAPILIRDCQNIATSFPNFCALAAKLGLNIKEVGT
ncbi:MAG: 3-phosphoshikimate 1-carboxyvinyltransferase [Candidatus Berkiellales bacterium]